MQLQERMRFELGLVYTVDVSSDMWYHPDVLDWQAPQQRDAIVSIEFTCDPHNAEGLVEEALAVVRGVAEAGPDAKSVAATQVCAASRSAPVKSVPTGTKVPLLSPNDHANPCQREQKDFRKIQNLEGNAPQSSNSLGI